MSKLVSQLRALAGMASSKHGDILKQAANEIERLSHLVTILVPGPGNRPGQRNTMAHLCVGGEFYDVLEDMCYQPSIGHYAKRVRWGTKGVRVAVSTSIRGPWRFWTQADVLQVTPRPIPPWLR